MKMPATSAAANINEEEEEDFISNLHNALLLRILSLLPEAEANRTRILSKRWKDLCVFLPNLRFVMPSTQKLKNFHDSVDQTLALRDGIRIQRFFLHCSKSCDYNRVYDLLYKVARFNVEEIEFWFHEKHTVRFPLGLFKTCNSLVSLSLRGELVLHLPDSGLFFPRLKKIDLQSIVYSWDESFGNLISASPVLEELCVERNPNLRSGIDHLEVFRVSSPSLKRLRLSVKHGGGGYRSVIDAPNMEYLNISDLSTKSYVITKPLSLIEAHIKIHHRVESVDHLVACVSSVRILSICTSTLLALCFVDGLNLPVFPNVVNFNVVTDNNSGWNMFWTLLHRMPNLEHFTLAEGLIPYQAYFMRMWSPGAEVPACLQYKMKKIIFQNQETITPYAFNLIRYLLKYANILETLTMNAHNIDVERRDQILSFHRASKSCRIQLV